MSHMLRIDEFGDVSSHLIDERVGTEDSYSPGA